VVLPTLVLLASEVEQGVELRVEVGLAAADRDHRASVMPAALPPPAKAASL